MSGSKVTDPLKIGDLVLKNRLILGPMAGVTDLPFRLLCHEQGAGLVCMEMVSAKGISYRNRGTQAMLRTDPDEHPVSLQLFGRDPQILGSVVEMLEDQPFELIDFNMGCPVPKVVKNGEGSALMREPELAAECVREMVNHTKKPVTVKIRSGFAEGECLAPEVARYLEDAGAAAIAVHGRTREQYYSGTADWSVIRLVKETVGIPVIGNGDVCDGPSAQKMLDETGCDGIMVGRAARGNPWVFDRILKELPDERPGVEELTAMILRHALLMVKCKGEDTAMRQMRAHIGWYSKGMHGGSEFRRMGAKIEHYEELEELMDFCRHKSWKD